MGLNTLFSSGLAAQTTISGVVMDGLAARPLAAAAVQLVLASDPGGKMQTADTDSSGAFHLDGVKPGTYLLTFVHPRLEELGIELPPRQITVPTNVPSLRYDLAVPGPRAMARLLCGEPMDSSGVLAGRVFNADSGTSVAAGTVTASWVELRMFGSMVRRTPRQLKASLDDAGRFAICGVPSDIPVRVQAIAGASRSGEFELHVPPLTLLHRHLFVAPMSSKDAAKGATGRLRGSARVVGHVRGPDGRPIDRAQVLLLDSGASAVSDAGGAFTLDSLPAGTRALEVRALGFVPAHVVLDLKSGSSLNEELTLRAHTTVLDAVTVYGKAPNRSAAGEFAERSRGMFGKFYTGEQVAKSGVSALPELFRMVPGLRLTQAPGSMLTTVLARGEGFDGGCKPDIYLDGLYIPDGATSLDNLVRPSEIGGIEVYVDVNTVPVQFKRSSCGAIVIWTKIMLP